MPATARRWRRHAVLIAGLVTVAAGLPTLVSATVSAAPQVLASNGPDRVVAPTTVTGDRIVASRGPNGKQSYTVRSAAGGAATGYQAANGDSYVIPAVAAPYVGRQLDRSLFDVTAIARQGARIPVTLAFAVGAQPTAPAGVTLTSVNGLSANGFLTPESGRAFAAALRSKIGADVKAGRRPGSTAVADGLTSMRLATAPPPAATPRYPMQILQIAATDLTGAPGNFDVTLMNTDSLTKTFTAVPVVDGVGRIAVPAGHYAASAGVVTYDEQGTATAIHQVMINDFTVADSPVNTVAIDLRAATSRVAVTHTPRPATQDVLMVSHFRLDSTGDGVNFWSGMWGAFPVYVNPKPAATTGTLHYLVQWGGTAPDSADGYRYNVAFPSDNGVPADQSYTVEPADLATVHQRIAADPAFGGLAQPAFGATDSVVNREWGTPMMGSDVGVPVPGTVTQYLGTADGGRWGIGFSWGWKNLFGDAHTYTAGREYTVDWGHGPLAPGLGQFTGNQRCFACIAGGVLGLTVPVLRDGVPDHTLGDMPPPGTVHLRLDRDGTPVYDGSQVSTVVQSLPTTPGTFHATLDVDLTGQPDVSQSTSTHTELTVRQSAADPALPAPSTCAGMGTGTPCRILPVLTLGYRLDTDETNTSTKPGQTLRLDVGHLSYDGAGSRAPITKSTVDVSFDDGASWHPATVTGTGGHYKAVWSNPATATAPELRVTAADADGNTISQTIMNAYALSPVRDVCGAAAPGQARCLAEVRTDRHGGKGVRTTAPTGYGPDDLRAAYHLPTAGGADQTVAIVDAGDDPTAEADLAVYRSTYGLPPCTTANGCFRKANQHGASSPLPPDRGWGPEIALDLDMVSAACPSCHILLVEADEQVGESMAAAVDTAALLGATEISNSYGVSEQKGIDQLAPSYRHPGIAVVASSGDSSFGIPNAPAVFDSVIAAGGTSLTRTATGWSESAWKGAGSGCSAWFAKPAWQHDPNCPGRMSADVAAVADPQTGVAVYTTTGWDGWLVAGGTSASAPLVAGVIGLGGHPELFPDASYLYTHASRLHDVVAGNNVGITECGGDYQCTALPGYDGPTGNGTPDGLGAFGA